MLISSPVFNYTDPNADVVDDDDDIEVISVRKARSSPPSPRWPPSPLHFPCPPTPVNTNKTWTGKNGVTAIS